MEVINVSGIHTLGTMNVCAKFHVIHLAVFNILHVCTNHPTDDWHFLPRTCWMLALLKFTVLLICSSLLEAEVMEKPTISVLVTLRARHSAGAVIPAVRELHMGCTTKPSKKVRWRPHWQPKYPTDTGGYFNSCHWLQPWVSLTCLRQRLTGTKHWWITTFVFLSVI